MSDLRVAGIADLPAAGETLALPAEALAPALTEPAVRLLVGPGGEAVLLQRQWSDKGFAEAVVRGARGAELDHPDVLGTAVAWGCERVRTVPGVRSVDVPPPGDAAPLADRFRHLAALAATRVELAVALASGRGEERTKSDGSPSVAADDAAHRAAAEVLAGLGLPLLSEERRDGPVDETEPWLVLDPLDGTGNFSAGFPPWAFSVALVRAGRPEAGVVVDLSSGRRWEAARGSGARRDGRPVRPRPGTKVIVPTAPPGRPLFVPSGARRLRITGCTAVDLCLVADGSAAAWHDLDRRGTHVHDVAGGLSVLAAAGGVALDSDGAPLRLRPDTEQAIRLVAAADDETARNLLREFGRSEAVSQ